jgi:hypothetical protein
MNNELTISLEENGMKIDARLISIGDDLVILLSGGLSHVGAVALSHKGSAAAVIAVPGHREDGPAKDMAEALSTAMGRTVAVVAGLHWDDLSKEGIATALRLCERLTQRIITEMEAEHAKI